MPLMGMRCVHSETCCPLGNCIPPLPPPALPRHGRLDRRTLHFSAGLAMPGSTGPDSFSLGSEKCLENTCNAPTTLLQHAVEPELQKLRESANMHNFKQQNFLPQNFIFYCNDSFSDPRSHVKRCVTWVMWQSYICRTCQNITRPTICQHQHHDIKCLEYVSFECCFSSSFCACTNVSISFF